MKIENPLVELKRNYLEGHALLLALADELIGKDENQPEVLELQTRLDTMTVQMEECRKSSLELGLKLPSVLDLGEEVVSFQVGDSKIVN